MALPDQQPNSLEDLRRQIDDVDARLVELLNERARIVMEVGRLKRRSSAAVYDPLRETEVLRRAAQASQGDMPEAAVRAIFREIMSACIALEHPLKVAYLGPQSTFSHLAAQAKFGSSVEYVPHRDILGIFRAVASGAANVVV